MLALRAQDRRLVALGRAASGRHGAWVPARSRIRVAFRAVRAARAGVRPPARGGGRARAGCGGRAGLGLTTRPARPKAACGSLPVVGRLDGRGLDALHLREGSGGGLPDDPRPGRARGDAARPVRRDRDAGSERRGDHQRAPPGTLPPSSRAAWGRRAGRAQSFVEAGGTLVALDSASRAAHRVFELDVSNALAPFLVAAQRRWRRRRRFYGPAPLATPVEGVSALVNGLEAETPCVQSSAGLRGPPRPGGLRVPHQDPLLSGWLLGGHHLQGKAALVETRVGKGRVVLSASGRSIARRAGGRNIASSTPLHLAAGDVAQ